MTRDEIEDLAENAAEKAAEKAMGKFLLALGLDTTDGAGVLRAQALMLHLANQYDACQTVKRHGLKTAVVTIVTALAAYALLFVGLPRPH